MTQSPTSRLLLSPSGALGRLSHCGSSTLITARSVSSSVPTTTPRNVRPSVKVTWQNSKQAVALSQRRDVGINIVRRILGALEEDETNDSGQVEALARGKQGLVGHHLNETGHLQYFAKHAKDTDLTTSRSRYQRSG